MDFSRALLITGSNGAFLCNSTAELLFCITEFECIFGEISKSTDCFAQVSVRGVQFLSFQHSLRSSLIHHRENPWEICRRPGLCWGSPSNSTQSKYRNKALHFLCCFTNRLMFQDSVVGFFFPLKLGNARPKMKDLLIKVKAMNR